ncbi:MAG: RNA 2'-phosphotransferase [Mastigocoleus sp. MO_167.B18]|nr:RNA 2'-phosphotransferase [Mastigocoleus sp. MO_167.B18]
MNSTRLIKVSKYLSRHLRHQPEKIGITLKKGGWVKVDELLRACKKNGFPISRWELDEVVANNDKKRFSFDETGNLIRANQGHSVKIDLQLVSQIPPDILYHGTGHKSIESILTNGLSKMSRHHVHLSADITTAQKVGARHGKPIVLLVHAMVMHKNGYLFYCSENGVWLVDNVPPKYLQIQET